MDAAPPIWREARFGGELRALRRSGLLDGVGSEGRGLPVLLVPGLFAPDSSLTFLARYLKHHGFRPRRAGIASNVDCSEREMARLLRRVELAADQAGSRVAVLGHSRGGLFGRALAVRRPDLVGGVVCLGSPLLDPLVNIHPFLHLQLALVASLGDRRVPRLASHACVDASVVEQLEQLASRNALTRLLVRKLRSVTPGDCCKAFWRDLRAALPDDVSFLSIYSRTDGVVSHRACLDPAARQLEVHSSHCGMAWNPEVFTASLEELAAVAARERAADPAPGFSAAA